MSLSDRMSTFLRRALIYQYLAFWVYTRFSNLTLYGNELKDKVNSNLAYFEIENEQIKTQLENPEQLLNYLLILESVLICAALLGTRFSAYFLGVLTSFTTFLYYNPLLKQNSIKGYFGVQTDLVLSVGVILAIFLDQFYVNEEDEQYVYDAPEQVVEEESKGKQQGKKGKKNK